MQAVNELGDRLHEALFNSKNKEKEVTEIVSNSNLATRISISQYYDAAYGKKLQDDLKSQLSSKFRDLVMYLFLSPIDLDIEILKKAMKGFSIDEIPIFEILTSRPKWMIDDIKKTYKSTTGRDLSQDFEKNFSGNLKRNVISLLNNYRSTTERPNKNQCEKDAEMLKNTKEDNWFNDEKIFDTIFVKKSPEELVMICRYYFKKTGIPLNEVIEKKLSGKNKQLMKEILFNTINPSEMFADKIYYSMKGLGTDSNTLNRILASRSEIDMNDIREIYNWKYKSKLVKDINSDTSGDYKTLCCYLAQK